jgi:hypothetical protein
MANQYYSHRHPDQHKPPRKVSRDINPGKGPTNDVLTGSTTYITSRLPPASPAYDTGVPFTKKQRSLPEENFFPFFLFFHFSRPAFRRLRERHRSCMVTAWAPQSWPQHPSASRGIELTRRAVKILDIYKGDPVCCFSRHVLEERRRYSITYSHSRHKGLFFFSNSLQIPQTRCRPPPPQLLRLYIRVPSSSCYLSLSLHTPTSPPCLLSPYSKAPRMESGRPQQPNQTSCPGTRSCSRSPPRVSAAQICTM